MPSEAQVVANRRNAEKSTGPRTPEGKAVVAQNAVKHGLLARQAVIKDEDPAEFELHRRQMLDELAPEGAVEETLAERVVGLSWRLKRAERMQDEALDYLIEADRGDDWVRHRRSGGDPSAGTDLAFGRAVARDFAEKKTLDRLMMYERRIENSLYKTMSELHKLRLMRKTDGGQCPPYKSESAEQASDCAKQSQSAEVSSLKCQVSSGTGPVPGGDLMCETKPIDGSVSCEVSSVKPEDRTLSLQTSHFKPDTSPEPPCGVTTNAKQNQSADHPSAHAGETQDIASLRSVATNEASRAKQSQSARLAVGVRTVLRARPRVACHSHNVARSY